jgi:hypothetical protein
MSNFITYKNVYSYAKHNKLLNIYLLKDQNKYMFDLVQLSRCLDYSYPNYLINYYIYKKGYLINNCYFDYYTDYEGLEIISNKLRKESIKQIMKDINEELI